MMEAIGQGFRLSAYAALAALAGFFAIIAGSPQASMFADRRGPQVVCETACFWTRVAEAADGGRFC